MDIIQHATSRGSSLFSFQIFRPDFYINKVDNTESHGPGGQYQHAIEEQGDSCFAKITRGKENAAALFAQPIYGDRSEWHHFMIEPVQIIKAEILTKHPEVGPAVNVTSTSTTVTKTTTNADSPETTKSGTKGDDLPMEPPHDPVQAMNDKLKRKPRLPKIEHAVEP